MDSTIGLGALRLSIGDGNIVVRALIFEQPACENFERNYVYQFYKGDAIDIALTEFLNKY
jgi:hypothetical protein